MEPIVRPYRSGEEEYVADLHERLYSEEYGWGPEFVRYAVEIPRHFAAKERNGREELFIAEQNGRPVGSLMLCAADDPDVGRLRVFAVEKDCRRQGIGAALLRAAMEKAESAGYRSPRRSRGRRSLIPAPPLPSHLPRDARRRSLLCAATRRWARAMSF